MKIAILDAANLTPFYNYALAEALATNGHEVEYLSTVFINDPNLQKPHSVSFNDFYFQHFRSIQQNSDALRKWIRLAQYLPDHLRLILHLRHSRPDILHIQWSRIAIIDRLLVAAIHQLGIPVIHTVHDVDPLFRIGSSKAISRLYSSVDKIIVHSHSLHRQFRTLYPNVNPDSIHVIPHGPLQETDHENQISKPVARERLGINQSEFVVLFFGEIKHYKGLDILLEAAVKAATTIDNLHILIAGKPDTEASLPDITALTTAGVRTTCNFSFIPNEEVDVYFSAADVVALPYRKISQSGVIFSAISQAKPVICSDTGGLKEVIEDTQAGWLFTPCDTDELSTALYESYQRKDSLAAMGENAKALMTEKYSWNNIAKLTIEAYQSAIQKRNP